MGLLDLDKIIIKQTILGIRCSACGGNLVAVSQQSLASRLIRVVSLGTVMLKSYECELCRKRFLLLS